MSGYSPTVIKIETSDLDLANQLRAAGLDKHPVLVLGNSWSVESIDFFTNGNLISASFNLRKLDDPS